jgi:hypothetical protein
LILSNYIINIKLQSLILELDQILGV